MIWRIFAAGARASVIFGVLTSSLAFAEVRISGDPGGEVAAYLHKYEEIRDFGTTRRHRRAVPFGVYLADGDHTQEPRLRHQSRGARLSRRVLL